MNEHTFELIQLQIKSVFENNDGWCWMLFLLASLPLSTLLHQSVDCRLKIQIDMLDLLLLINSDSYSIWIFLLILILAVQEPIHLMPPPQKYIQFVFLVLNGIRFFLNEENQFDHDNNDDDDDDNNNDYDYDEDAK